MQRRCPLWSIRRKLRRKSGAGRPAGRRFCAGCWQRLPARACSRTSRACAARCFWRCWCCLCRSGRWRSGWRSSRRACGASGRRRVRTAAIAALFLLAACIAPRETAEPAAPERVIEAGIQEETKTPAADEPAQEQPSEPDIPDTEPEPETPADIDPESETPTSAEPEVPSPAAPDPAPAEPSPSPVQSETVYITQTGKKYHRAGCRHLQQSQIPISLDDAKAKGYTACKSCGG